MTRRPRRAVLLALAVAFSVACGDGPLAPRTSAPSLLSHVGPPGALHLEIAGTSKPAPDAFDFDAEAYAPYSGSAADVRIGGPVAYDGSVQGYQELIGLNGGTLANLGLADFAAVDCTTAAATTFSTSVGTYLGSSPGTPTLSTVFLVKTASGAVAKLIIHEIDFTAPNGLRFGYVMLGCPVGPPPPPPPPAPIGSQFHLEVADVAKAPDAFDFETGIYAAYASAAADVRLGGPLVFDPTNPAASFQGYQELVGLNGGTVANLGLVDAATVDCTTAAGATFTPTVATYLSPYVPTLGTVFLVKTGAGLVAKLQLDAIDFTRPNGLTFSYQVLGCAPPPPPPTAEELLDQLAETLQAMEGAGDVPTTGVALRATLDAAGAAVARGNTTAARGQLNAFINRVEALMKGRGRISQANGEALIALARAAIAALEG